MRFRSAFLRIQRKLGLEDGIPVLKKWFREKPAVDLAELLSDLGDPAGEDYLQELMNDKTETIQVQAARALCSRGQESAADFLLDFAVSKKSAFMRSSYSVLASFQKYIARRGLQDPRSRKILDLVMKLVDQPRYQATSFRVIKEAAGEDFGYYSSSSTRFSAGSQGTGRSAQPSLAQRRRKAVEAARAWWKKEKSESRDAPAK